MKIWAVCNIKFGTMELFHDEAMAEAYFQDRVNCFLVSFFLKD